MVPGPWSHGPMVPWSHWSMVPWSHWSHGPIGPMAPWSHGACQMPSEVSAKYPQGYLPNTLRGTCQIPSGVPAKYPQGYLANTLRGIWQALAGTPEGGISCFSYFELLSTVRALSRVRSKSSRACSEEQKTTNLVEAKGKLQDA